MDYRDIVSNPRIYGLAESVLASGYPMRTHQYDQAEFLEEVEDIKDLISRIDSQYKNSNKHYVREKKLSQTGMGEGHDNSLVGIVIQFDLTFTVKAWTEAERYHFFDIVSSMSTMHRLTKMDFDTCFNSYVTENTKNEMKRLLNVYNENPCAENKLVLLYNCPTGLKLTARMTTNYRQLKTIYRQRKNHQLPEWRVFCEWIKTLPCSEFITGENDE